MQDNLLATAERLMDKYHLTGHPRDYLGELEADREFLSAVEAKIALVPEFSFLAEGS